MPILEIRRHAERTDRGNEQGALSPGGRAMAESLAGPLWPALSTSVPRLRVASSTELTDAVAAMTGSGLDCTITQLPAVLSLFGLKALADSNGASDFAVGGGQYNADGICGPLPTTINIGFSAHVPADWSMPDTPSGSISETVSQPGGPCDGDRRKVYVTCLEVGPSSLPAGGTQGWMDGTVTQATGYFLGSVTLGLTAWGKPTKPDFFNDNRNLPNCHTHVLQPNFEFFHGNIVVKDR